MKNILLVITLAFSFQSFAQEINIIPQPVSVNHKQGSFQLNKATVLVTLNKADKPSVDFFNDYLQKYYGFKLMVANKLPASNYIGISTWNDPSFADKKEHYQLIVDPKFIRITAPSHHGSFLAIQSLIQLLPVSRIQHPVSGIQLPSVVIEDSARFGYRGMHFDVCRHFFSIDYVKKYIDYLALHKFNTFHWHLTDDQGWRIQIKKYPKLTSVGGWRNGTIIGRYPGKGNDSIHYGGFYTQDEIREVVRYAADRFITVIPEIEMPGHASAAIAAYPELSCFPNEDTKVAKGTAWAGSTKGKQVQQAWGVFDDIFCAGKENTFKFLEGVLDEVLPLFPSKFIHIGGDEAPKAHWKRCPNCQQRIKTLGLKDEHELQSYFIQRMEKYLNGKGRQIIGWDEILEGGLAPNATVMSWRGEKGGIEAAKQKHTVIMTPSSHVYFDHQQTRNEDSVTIGGFSPIEKVYAYEPIPKVLSDEEGKYVLGAQANLWAEYIKNTRKVEYQLFPRIAALSEVLWTPKEKKDSADFERRLMTQFKRYDLWGVNYSKAFLQIKSTILPTPDNSGLLYKLESKFKGGWITTNINRVDSIDVYLQPVSINRSLTIYSSLIDSTNKKLIAQLAEQFSFNKATAKKISLSTSPASNYSGNGGAFGLVNGVKADKFNSTEWLGWTKSVEINIDLGKEDTIKEVALNVWKQEPSWIYLPVSIEVSTKDAEGKSINLATVQQPASGWADNRRISIPVNPQKVTNIQVKVNNLSKIPEGRQGAGNPAYIFLDEIEIH